MKTENEDNLNNKDKDNTLKTAYYKTPKKTKAAAVLPSSKDNPKVRKQIKKKQAGAKPLKTSNSFISFNLQERIVFSQNIFDQLFFIKFIMVS